MLLKTFLYCSPYQDGDILPEYAPPHAAMIHTHDGTFQSSCDASKSYAMLYDADSNMLVILLPILKYLSHLLSDSQTVFNMMMTICYLKLSCHMLLKYLR